MSNKFNNYKQTLINFFEDSQEGYLVYGKTLNKKVTYLYSKTAKIQIIKLAVVKKPPENGFDRELEYLKQELSQQLETIPESVTVLEVYLSNNFENNFVKKDNTVIVITNSWDYLVHSLAIDFPKLGNLEDPDLIPQSDSAKINNSDFNLEDIKSPEDLKKRLSVLNLQLKNGNSLATMIISIMFFVAPFVIAIASTIVLNWVQSGSSRALVFGGSTYTLTILGGQWWRILTYGFSAGGDLFTFIFMLILAWVGFRRLRLNELMVGTWKMLGTFFLAYLLTGFFLSILGSGVTSGSDGIAFAIIVGMIALTVGGSKSALATTAKSQLIWPIILLIIYGIVTSFSGHDSFIPMLVGFIIGGTMAFMFTYDYKELNWRLWMGVILLLAFILIPVAMLIVPTYVPGVDYDVLTSLASYLNLNWISIDQANNIVDKIGWDNVDWNKVNNIIWVIIR